MRSVLPTFVLGLVALTAGCGYKLGNTPSRQLAGSKTIYVPVVRSKIYEPSINVMFTDAIIRRLHQDGTLQVVREAPADTSLEVVLTDIRRNPLRSVRGDSRLVAELRVQVRADITLYQRGRSVPLIKEESIWGDTEFFLSDDQQESERQALGLVAEDLAERIVRRVTENW